MDRENRKNDINEAHALQTRAGLIGAARSTGVGLGLATISHYTWPLFRRQTLAFKGFVVSMFTIFGLIVSAENALQSHEAEKRQIETALRREARLELARRGRVATETEIAKWKAGRSAQLAEAEASSRSGS